MTTESDTCRKFVDPKPQASGWDKVADSTAGQRCFNDDRFGQLKITVAAAYGWPADLMDEQILKKHLALNLACAAEAAKMVKVKKT
jgi:hypothetical protein